VGLFTQRKNKQFGYKPRYLQDSEAQNGENMGAKWRGAKRPSAKNGKSPSRLVILSVVLIMVIVIWKVLDNY